MKYSLTEIGFAVFLAAGLAGCASTANADGSANPVDEGVKQGMACVRKTAGSDDCAALERKCAATMTPQEVQFCEGYQAVSDYLGGKQLTPGAHGLLVRHGFIQE